MRLSRHQAAYADRPANLCPFLAVLLALWTVPLDELLAQTAESPSPAQSEDSGGATPQAMPQLPSDGLAPPASVPDQAGGASQTSGAVEAGQSPAAAIAGAPPQPAPPAQSAGPGGVTPAPGEASGSSPSQQNSAQAPASPTKATLPQDLSPWGMFKSADIVVKAVMIGLGIASFITWTIWLAKAIELHGAKRRLRRAVPQIASAQNLAEAVETFSHLRGMGAVLVREAAEELMRSARVLDHAGAGGIKERITSRLSRVEAAAAQRISFGTGMLATIGATAPFVGLFGTVWGIMNSFIGISHAQTTNLAVVAPGIAEALLATALGLVAAIPAVIIYNVFARSIGGYKLLLADASAAVERLISRDLDLRRVPEAAPAPVHLARAAE